MLQSNMGHSVLKMDRILITAILGVFILFCYKLYRARSYFRWLQKQGLPMPPHHPILGHLLVMAKIMKDLPPYIAGGYVGTMVRRAYPDLPGTAMYLDVWPFGQPLLGVMHPEMSYQLTQANQLPKYSGLRTFVAPLTGKEDLVTMEGQNWKRWRGIFNPGFSGSHINSLVPDIVEKVQVFKERLAEKAAAGKMFQLEKLTLSLTVDTIGGAVLDHDFGSQRGYNDMVAAFHSQLLWCTMGLEVSPLEHLWDPLRPFVHRYNTWRMDRYLNRILEERYNSLSTQKQNLGKSAIDLALKAYLAENPSAETIPAPFKEAALSQIKLFIFAGHDTTSSAIIHTLHCLSKHPEVMKKVRDEHDSVFGPNPADAPALLKERPHLLNQLPYTLAAIKEALRIYNPVSGAVRDGQPGFDLVSPDGQIFPTENCMVFGDHFGNHHNPDIWPRVEEYLPERFLVKEGHELYPPKDAWRPFERGPRNCLGQELALTEIRVILALTAREYSIRDAYKEFDTANGNKNIKGVNGDRAYMVRIGGGGHPADGYPCRVNRL